MFNIYCRVPEGAAWTGHLHSTPSREGAESWKREFESQGYREVFVVESEALEV